MVENETNFDANPKKNPSCEKNHIWMVIGRNIIVVKREFMSVVFVTTIKVVKSAEIDGNQSAL